MQNSEYEALSARAKQAAEKVRADLWGDRLPVDPAIIAGKLGIRVVQATMAEGVSGFIKKEAESDPLIALCNTDSAARQRFTCAHELGHFIQHQGQPVFSYVDLRVAERTGPKPAEEIYADFFASNLLMPESLMRKLASSKNPELWQLARQFGVSVEAMKVRRSQLKLG